MRLCHHCQIPLENEQHKFCSRRCSNPYKDHTKPKAKPEKDYSYYLQKHKDQL